MAPSRVAEDDPVTAEYDVYLTQAHEEEVLLLQYPNRSRERPYNDRLGAAPEQMRVKSKTGYIEVDIPLSTTRNFNKFQSLRWGDAMRSMKELQNDGATYGLASGLPGPRHGLPRRANLKDPAERELQLENDLAFFDEAERSGKVMGKQTLGGQIARHDSAAEAGKPLYFVGAFRGSELHLTHVHGTVQVRPQFHHVDAEDQRSRMATSREHAAALGGDSATNTATAAKSDRTLLQQTFKTSNPKGELDQRQKEMDEYLRTANEEKWIPVRYVDEEAEEAYDMYHQRLFIKNVMDTIQLESAMDNDTYLDAISAPREGSPTRRRKRPLRRRNTYEDEDDEQ